MPYYGDSSSYYYGGGSSGIGSSSSSAFSNHSSLLTGFGRYHSPIAARYSPHLSTISETPIIVLRRYGPTSSATSSATSLARPRRIIDTADIDVTQVPRSLAQDNRQQQRHRLRRDRPTIKIRSQALKDNPALREYNEKHEKTVGEMLVEKFLIKDKQQQQQQQSDSGPTKMRLYHQASLMNDKEQENELLAAIRHRITRRMTRRRSSADVIPLDPEQLEREAALQAAQEKVLDELVAEEQAEIENEVRRGTFTKKQAMRLPLEVVKVSESEEDDEMDEEDRQNGVIKKHVTTKKKKRKKSLEKQASVTSDGEDEFSIAETVIEEEEFEWDDREKCDDLSMIKDDVKVAEHKMESRSEKLAKMAKAKSEESKDTGAVHRREPYKRTYSAELESKEKLDELENRIRELKQEVKGDRARNRKAKAVEEMKVVEVKEKHKKAKVVEKEDKVEVTKNEQKEKEVLKEEKVEDKEEKVEDKKDKVTEVKKEEVITVKDTKEVEAVKEKEPEIKEEFKQDIQEKFEEKTKVEGTKEKTEEKPKIKETKGKIEEKQKIKETKGKIEVKTKTEETKHKIEDKVKTEETKEKTKEQPKIKETKEIIAEKVKIEETTEKTEEKPKIKEAKEKIEVKTKTEETKDKIEEKIKLKETKNKIEEKPKIEETKEKVTEIVKIEEMKEKTAEKPEIDETKGKIEEKQKIEEPKTDEKVPSEPESKIKDTPTKKPEEEPKQLKTPEPKDKKPRELRDKPSSKIDRLKRTASAPAPPIDDNDEIKTTTAYKIEACNSVGDFSTLYVKTAAAAAAAAETIRTIEQFRESIRLPAPRNANKIASSIETEVVLPVRKPYVRDPSRNSVHLALKPRSKLIGATTGGTIIEETRKESSEDVSSTSRPANNKCQLESDVAKINKGVSKRIDQAAAAAAAAARSFKSLEERLKSCATFATDGSVAIDSAADCANLGVGGKEEFKSWWDEESVPEVKDKLVLKSNKSEVKSATVGEKKKVVGAATSVTDEKVRSKVVDVVSPAKVGLDKAAAAADKAEIERVADEIPDEDGPVSKALLDDNLKEVEQSASRADADKADDRIGDKVEEAVAKAGLIETGKAVDTEEKSTVLVDEEKIKNKAVEDKSAVAEEDKSKAVATSAADERVKSKVDDTSEATADLVDKAIEKSRGESLIKATIDTKKEKADIIGSEKVATTVEAQKKSQPVPKVLDTDKSTKDDRQQQQQLKSLIHPRRKPTELPRIDRSLHKIPEEPKSPLKAQECCGNFTFAKDKKAIAKSPDRSKKKPIVDSAAIMKIEKKILEDSESPRKILTTAIPESQIIADTTVDATTAEQQQKGEKVGPRTEIDFWNEMKKEGEEEEEEESSSAAVQQQQQSIVDDDTSNKLKLDLTQIDGTAEEDPKTPLVPTPETPLVHHTSEVPVVVDTRTSSITSNGEKQEEEEQSGTIKKISKWTNCDNLNEADKGATPVASKEASPRVSTTAKKKKIVKRKKSATTTGTKKKSEKAGADSAKKKVVKKAAASPQTSQLAKGMSSSPRNTPAQRPADLSKLLYTTPAILLTATPRDLRKVRRAKVKKKKPVSVRTPSLSSDSTGSTRSTATTTTSTEEGSNCEEDVEQRRLASTRSNDSGFDGSPRLLNCDMVCHKKCEKLTGNLCGLNQKLVAEALEALKARAPSQSSENQRNAEGEHYHHSGRITPPATNLPRFKKYEVTDFNFLKVLGKGSFGKVLLAELRGTECVYAVKCLKKDVVLEDDDVECTLIERKVLTLATRHPYLCHLFCTFQTESHLFFVMEYLNGGDLMFHIQKSGRFSEARARFYAAEIWSGLIFLHKKGIVYRDLKLDNVLLDFEGHIRIADFGMCKLQIFLDRTADTFCGTPDYMAPEIIKGLKYNQAVDWWSFGVLLYEMLTGQSPFSGCDEDELFWSICNERPFIPRYLSQSSTDVLVCLLEKDAGKRIPGHEIACHTFFSTIAWDKLERRTLEPPFKPEVAHTLDTRYFDTAFTTERPRLTPIPEQILTSMDQAVFRGFSYTNPNATD